MYNQKAIDSVYNSLSNYADEKLIKLAMESLKKQDTLYRHLSICLTEGIIARGLKNRIETQRQFQINLVQEYKDHKGADAIDNLIEEIKLAIVITKEEFSTLPKEYYELTSTKLSLYREILLTLVEIS